MKADPASQRRLLDLQVVDAAIARLEHRVRTLAVHVTISDLATERSGASDRVIAAETRRSDAEAARVKAEADVVPVRERLVRNQKRVDDGHMEAKALSSMIAEIEHLKGRILDLEDQELVTMETLEQAEADLAAATERAQTVETDLRAAVAERDATVAEARVEMKDLRGRRQVEVAVLPADLLALYDKLRARYNGVGVGRLQGNRCTACGLESTTADYNAYVASPPDEVLRCAECERILVRATD
jgi:predicted  nucleic acid-binding Zn-ribbon protein